MITCPHCKKEFRLTFPKRSYEQRVKYRHSTAWGFVKEIFEKYQSGYAIMWLARDYKADKRIIKDILTEAGVKEFRGRKGIQAWNKGKIHPKVSGDKHHSWKGGITPLMVRIRRCARYRQWVKDVFFKDNYTCQICNKKGGYIQADHYPKMFSDIISNNKIKTYEEAMDCQELWSLDNGRTLCKECHQKTFIFKGNQFKSQN